MRKGDLVDQAIAETGEMFTNAKTVFVEAVATLKENRDSSFDIYKLDQKINQGETAIRRKLLENMAMNPRQDIVASLVLTSIIIDIERIGDYSKNIYELRKLCTKKSPSIDQELIKQAEFLAGQFDAISKVFGIGDMHVGQQLMDRLDPIRKSFDKYISDVVNKSGIEVADAVVNALFARYLKRVGAHLENVASSAANPFDKIGFYKKEPID